jgi:hypothetical protein
LSCHFDGLLIDRNYVENVRANHDGANALEVYWADHTHQLTSFRTTIVEKQWTNFFNHIVDVKSFISQSPSQLNFSECLIVLHQP